MKIVSDKYTCPVCDTPDIGNDQYLSYRRIDFYFCSRQCLERFQAYPHLYIGDPYYGLSEKQKGTVVRKSHRLQLLASPDETGKKEMRERLGLLMGVEQMYFEDDNLYVIYDLMQVSLSDIEQEVESVCAELDHSLTTRLKRGFIHYSEECTLESLAHLSKDNKYR